MRAFLAGPATVAIFGVDGPHLGTACEGAGPSASVDARLAVGDLERPLQAAHCLRSIPVSAPSTGGPSNGFNSSRNNRTRGRQSSSPAGPYSVHDSEATSPFGSPCVGFLDPLLRGSKARHCGPKACKRALTACAVIYRAQVTRL